MSADIYNWREAVMDIIQRDIERVRDTEELAEMDRKEVLDKVAYLNRKNAMEDWSC